MPVHWPYGEVAAEHPAARYAQAFAAALHEAIGPASYREVARRTGVSHGTIAALLRGDTWADLVTISKLEWAIGKPLWPGPLLFAEQLRGLRGLRAVQAEYLRFLSHRSRR